MRFVSFKVINKVVETGWITPENSKRAKSTQLRMDLRMNLQNERLNETVWKDFKQRRGLFEICDELLVISIRKRKDSFKLSKLHKTVIWDYVCKNCIQLESSSNKFRRKIPKCPVAVVTVLVSKPQT